MTQFDLPATEDTDSINSSLLSQSSSSANSSGSNRSLSSRSSFGFANIGALHANQSVERGHVPAAVIPSPIHQEFGTLDAILRRASQSECLETMTYIQMRVSSDVFGLHQMHIFLPNLVALNLHSSSLKSLRHLGCNVQLKYLNVSRCGLKSFDGISGFECVEHLVADDNEITDAMQLSVLGDLQTLSVRGNKIEQLSGIGFLSMCHKLRDLDLTNNAIAQRPDHRPQVKRMLPALLILDGFVCDVANEQFTASDASSSLSSEWSKDISVSSGTPSRSPGCTSQSVDNAPAKRTHRPLTAESTPSCSYGEPVVGNIVNRVRRRKQTGNDQPMRVHDPPPTSMANVNSSAEQTRNGLESDERQQHDNGATATTSNTAQTLPIQRSGFQQDATNLIEMCRKWRDSSRKTRETT